MGNEQTSGGSPTRVGTIRSSSPPSSSWKKGLGGRGPGEIQEAVNFAQFYGQATLMNKLNDFASFPSTFLAHHSGLAEVMGSPRAGEAKLVADGLRSRPKIAAPAVAQQNPLQSHRPSTRKVLYQEVPFDSRALQQTETATSVRNSTVLAFRPPALEQPGPASPKNSSLAPKPILFKPRPEKIERLDRPDFLDRGEKIERIDKFERAEKFDRVGGFEKFDRVERFEKGDRADRFEKGDRADKFEKGDKVEKFDRGEKFERAELRPPSEFSDVASPRLEVSKLRPPKKEGPAMNDGQVFSFQRKEPKLEDNLEDVIKSVSMKNHNKRISYFQENSNVGESRGEEQRVASPKPIFWMKKPNPTPSVSAIYSPQPQRPPQPSLGSPKPQKSFVAFKEEAPLTTFQTAGWRPDKGSMSSEKSDGFLHSTNQSSKELGSPSAHAFAHRIPFNSSKTVTGKMKF